MPKLRKMLGDIHSPECIAMMRLIETQSKDTLASWAAAYVKKNILGIYETECPESTQLREIITLTEACVNGEKKLAEIKPALKAAAQVARDLPDQPVAQAAARAIATACATVQTPTNALGFLFYCAAATAYSTAGTKESSEVYDRIAAAEFRRAYESLKQAAVEDEPNPAKIKWGC